MNNQKFNYIFFHRRKFNEIIFSAQHNELNCGAGDWLDCDCIKYLFGFAIIQELKFENNLRSFREYILLHKFKLHPLCRNASVKCSDSLLINRPKLLSATTSSSSAARSIMNRI